MRQSGSLSRLGRGLVQLVAAPWLLLVRHLPGDLGVLLRRRYWRRRLGALGEDVRIDEGVQIVNPQHVFIGSGCWIATGAFIGAGPISTEEREVFRKANREFGGSEGEIRLGDHVYVGPGALLNGHGGIEIADNSAVGPGAHVYSSSHHYRAAEGEPGRPTAPAGMRRPAAAEGGRQVIVIGPVVIRADSFVAAHSVTLPGVTMGPRTWLGPGAVARSPLEPGRMYRAPDPEPDP